MSSDSPMRLNLPMPLDVSEQALEEVFRHTPVGVVLTDLHGTIIDANHAFCALLQRGREEVLGQRFVSFIHPDEQSAADAVLEQLRDGEVEHAQYTRRYVGRDGGVITTRVTVSLVHSKDGESICGIAFIEDIGERLAMETALRDSEHRYRRVVEDQTELIVRCLPDGTRLFVNDAYCRYNEATAAELIGTSFFPCIVEEERDEIHRKFASLTPENPVLTDSHRIVDPRGAIRWHEWTDRGFFDEHGTLVEIQAVGRDVTEEREAQELLKRSEESFRLLFESLPVAVWETDLSLVMPELKRRGLDKPAKLIAAVEADPSIFLEVAHRARCTRANRAALTMTQSPGPEGVLAWLRERYTFEAAVSYARGGASVLTGEALVADLELPLRTPDGRRIDLLQRLARVSNFEESPRLIAITLDVTERRKTERDLAHRKQILEEAELLARVGSWEWDPTSDQIYGSAGFWRILNGTSEAAFASLKDVIQCFHPDDRTDIRENLRSLASGGQSLDDGSKDRRVVHPDGTVLIGRGVSFVDRNAAGEAVRVYGVVQDLSEQRRAEHSAQREREAMTRADKMISLGILVSGVAHEVNNPNHAILLNAPLLREAWKSIVPIVDDQEARHENLRVAGLPWVEMRDEAVGMIDDIEHAAERVRGIVTELRGFARSHDSGEHKPLFLNDVVQSSLRLLGNHIRKATSAFSVMLVHDLPSIRANAQRLEQVVINLLLNACQALESPTAMISIETGQTASHVFVRVTDAGRGIRKEDLAMIKDPFFTTKRAEGGSGLGLAVSERIVQEHGAELTFDSTPGRGTVATLSLPKESA